MLINQQKPFLDWELHEKVALVGYKLFFISVLKIRRNTVFVVYSMELLVALSYSSSSYFAFVGFACFCTGGSFFLWRALQCHSVLGDVAQKKKGKRTHKLSNSQPHCLWGFVFFASFEYTSGKNGLCTVAVKYTFLGKSNNTETTPYSPSWAPNRSL